MQAVLGQVARNVLDLSIHWLTDQRILRHPRRDGGGPHGWDKSEHRRSAIVMYASMLVFLEILLLSLAATVLFCRRGQAAAESISLGILFALIFLSVTFQFSFLMRRPQLSYAIEGVALLLGTLTVLRNRGTLRSLSNKVIAFGRRHRIVGASIALLWLYLFLLAFLIPPSNYDSMTYNLSRVLLFQQEGTLLLDSVTNLRQSILVVGADILPHAFLRFDSDFGVATFSFLAYLCIALGSYGIARRITDADYALVAAAAVLSLTELCLQATSTKNDIFVAAGVVGCFLLADRLLRKPRTEDFFLLLVVLSFGFSAKSTFVFFLIPFSIALAYYLTRSFGWSWTRAFPHSPRHLLLLAVPILIGSQLWLYAHNLASYGVLSGAGRYGLIQGDGLLGTIGNAIRYGFASIHLFPFDYWLEQGTGVSVEGALVSVYESLVRPVIGNAGLGGEVYRAAGWTEFVAPRFPHEDYSWFGPLGFLLAPPAIAYGVFRGGPHVRLMSLSLLGFVFLLSTALIWLPWNSRYVVPFFAGSAGCIAFLLQSLGAGKRARGLIVGVSVWLLATASILNVSKPLFSAGKARFSGESIWTDTRFGSDRFYYVRNHFGDDRIDFFRRIVPSEARVALITGEVAGSGVWTYPFHLVHRRLEPTSKNRFRKQASSYDYLLCVATECDLTGVPHRVLWSKEEFPTGLIADILADAYRSED